jgi:hypothetical protein
MNVDLAALHRQEHAVATAEANDHAVLDAEHIEREVRQQAGMIGVVERAEDQVLHLHDIGRPLDAARHHVGAAIDDAEVADTGGILEVLIARTHALIAQHLRQRIPRIEQHGEPVGLGLLVDEIGGADAGGARHVLDHDQGIARNMAAQMREEQARHGVDGAAGLDPDNYPQRLAGVVILRGRGRRQANGGEHGHKR